MKTKIKIPKEGKCTIGPSKVVLGHKSAYQRSFPEGWGPETREQTELYREFTGDWWTGRPPKYDGLEHSYNKRIADGKLVGNLKINPDGEGKIRCYGVDSTGLCYVEGQNGREYCSFYRTPEMIVENMEKTIKRTESRKQRVQSAIEKGAEKLAKEMAREAAKKKA